LRETPLVEGYLPFPLAEGKSLTQPFVFVVEEIYCLIQQVVGKLFARKNTNESHPFLGTNE
jgi:hypothetical protein